MPFYNFPALMEQDSSLVTRAKRTTFRQKMRDTFYIFAGSSFIFSHEHGLGLSKKDVKILEFGLIDYPLFFLKIAINGINKLSTLIKRTNNGTLLNFAGITGFIIGVVFLIFPLSIIQLVIAGLLSLLSTPFVAIIHAISQHQASQLKEALLENDKANQTLDKIIGLKSLEFKYNSTGLRNGIESDSNHVYQPCRELLDKHAGVVIDAIRFQQLSNGEIVKLVFLTIEERIGADRETYLLFCNTLEGRAAFNAFIELNIGNYEKFVIEHEALSENSTVKKSPFAPNTKSIFETLILLGSLSEENACKPKLPKLPAEIIEDIAVYTCHALGDDESESEKTVRRFTKQLGW